MSYALTQSEISALKKRPTWTNAIAAISLTLIVGVGATLLIVEYNRKVLAKTTTTFKPKKEYVAPAISVDMQKAKEQKAKADKATIDDIANGRKIVQMVKSQHKLIDRWFDELKHWTKTKGRHLNDETRTKLYKKVNWKKQALLRELTTLMQGSNSVNDIKTRLEIIREINEVEKYFLSKINKIGDLYKQ